MSKSKKPVKKKSAFSKKYGNKPVGAVVTWKGKKMKRIKKTGFPQWSSKIE